MRCIVAVLPYLPRASMEQRKSELLEQRAEPVPSRSVPDGVNFLVATVDVQAGRHRRFVVQVTGYGSVANAGLLIVTTSRSHCAVTATGRASELIRPAIRKTGMSC